MSPERPYRSACRVEVEAKFFRSQAADLGQFFCSQPNCGQELVENYRKCLEALSRTNKRFLGC